jgi:hypothetical protein
MKTAGMQEQLPRTSACQIAGIGRHVEVKRDVFRRWRRNSARLGGTREGEWLPAACELPVDLGKKGVHFFYTSSRVKLIITMRFEGSKNLVPECGKAPIAGFVDSD